MYCHPRSDFIIVIPNSKCDLYSFNNEYILIASARFKSLAINKSESYTLHFAHSSVKVYFHIEPIYIKLLSNRRFLLIVLVGSFKYFLSDACSPDSLRELGVVFLFCN